MFPTKPIIESHINYNMQLEIEEIMHNYSQVLQFKDIKNAAVFIIDNRTHQVITYVGSPDFYSNATLGQVDGVKAVRSPGSTLKPMIYGLAFDKGLYTPRSVISDVPVILMVTHQKIMTNIFMDKLLCQMRWHNH